MASLYDIVDAFHAMGKELKAVGAEAEASTKKVRENAKAQSDARSAGLTSGSKGGSMGASSSRDSSGSSSSLQNPSSSSSLSIETSSLGDPRNGPDAMMRLMDSIDRETRR